MKKILALVLTVLLVLGALVGCSGDPNKTDAPTELGMSKSPIDEVELTVDYEVPKDFKIGFICLHDENSTYDLNFLNAVDTIQKTLKLSNDQVIIKTNVPEGDECYVAAKDLVDSGCNIVFANSFGHEDFMIKAAKEFPDVQFCHATGTKAHTEKLDNFHNAFASIYEGRYLAGVAAGMKLNEMIENGEFKAEEAKIGYVGAFTYAEVMSGYTSFYLGAKSVCPTVTMDVQFTGSWYDAPKEKNAAEALIARDCKLISQHADSMGAPTACEAAGVPNVSYNGSTIDSCPNTYLISSRIDWAPYMTYIVRAVKAGAIFDTGWCGTLDTGSVALTELNEAVAAPGTMEKIQEVSQKLISGELHVYDTSTFTVTYFDEATFTNTSATTDADGHVTGYMANCVFDENYTPDTEVVSDGYLHESEVRSAPYFFLLIDGITLVG